jgi:hypothetical protein
LAHDAFVCCDSCSPNTSFSRRLLELPVARWAS